MILRRRYAIIHYIRDFPISSVQVKCDKRNGVDPEVIFGLDSKLFLDDTATLPAAPHHDEVETVTILRGEPLHSHSCSHGGPCSHSSQESTRQPHPSLSEMANTPLSKEQLISALQTLPKDIVWRVKGFLRLPSGRYILNWAFGRFDITPVESGGDHDVKFTMMGERGEVKRAARKFAQAIGANIV
jgi:G3E family GTPase